MLLKETQKEELKEEIYSLLWEAGMKIESEEITSSLIKQGCVESPSGRIKIPGKLIEDMALSQKKSQAEDEKDQELHLNCGIDWAHHIIWNKKQDEMRKRLKSEFLMSAFDCGPTTYYDYKEGKAKGVDTEIFIEMKKFAQATPEIGYISTWYRQDVPPEIERIDSLILALKYTDKVDGIEPMYPEVIKYLKEMSEIITGRPGDASYLAGSESMSSPLILESRLGEDMVERAKRGIKRYHIASMPTIGVSTPVTIAASIVMTAAEILGGMVAAFVIDPEADLSGRAIALVLDMRTANSTSSGPEPTLVNLAVRELFDTFWGGHLWVEVYFSPYAKRPGLQAVFENFYGVWRYSRLLGSPDIPYPGMGTLDDGGMGSATQFMLDMDIRKSQFALEDKIAMNDETLPFKEICEAVRDDKDFLSSEHTLKHFRKLWSSRIFLTDNPGLGVWEANEKSILDKCDELWRENLKNFEPPQWPEEKTKAFDDLLTRAKKELLK